MDRTAEVAARLARRWGGDAEIAFLAGLVHDAMKPVPLDRARAWIAALGAEVDEAEAASTDLLHGPLAAAALAAEGLAAPDLLAAVRHHTTGRPGMSPTEAALFVADRIEPARAGPAVEDLRRAAEAGMEAAVRSVLAQKAAHLRRNRKAIHPRALEALEHYR